MAAIHDPKHRNELVMRLKRIEGQLRGIQAMIGAGEDCEKVAQQISASRKALDKAFFNVLACAMQAEPAPGARSVKRSAESRVRHAAELLAKFG
jgi:DNA-binding FrmR family transcriptional regulator